MKLIIDKFTEATALRMRVTRETDAFEGRLFRNE